MLNYLSRRFVIQVERAIRSHGQRCGTLEESLFMKLRSEFLPIRLLAIYATRNTVLLHHDDIIVISVFLTRRIVASYIILTVPAARKHNRERFSQVHLARSWRAGDVCNALMVVG